MIKLVYCLRRSEGLTREEFQKYWRETHGPLVKERAQTLGVRRYVQVHTLESGLNQALAASRGCADEPFDGVAELWWDDEAALAGGAGSEEGRKAGRELLEDERKFIDLERSVIFVAKEKPVVEG
jgi:uncharacterized protein (TIGR02118 family)